LKAERGLDLLVVDYLQLATGHGRFENRTQEVSFISRSLKGIAKELNIPVLALSQLSRAPEQHGAGRPELWHLRESGSIEQDADVVMFIYRERRRDDEEDGQDPRAGVETKLIVGKQRNGPTGDVILVFLKPYVRFENPAFGDQQ
jgi:replicative DNA helicase